MEEARAEHRRQRQRHEGRDGDGRGDSDGEFAEQPSDDPAHQQERNEHGDKRQADRQHGEADLARAGQRRLERHHGVLDVAIDVLHYHDGIVDDEAHRDGERHQRQIVEAKPGEIHDRGGAEQREGHDQARYDGDAEIAQEQEDHEHHEADGDAEGELHVLDGSADRRGSVGKDIDGDRRWDHRLKPRQRLLDLVDGLDHVGAGLLVNDEKNCGLIVVPGLRVEVLRTVDRMAHVLDPHCSSVAIGNDHVVIVGRLGELIVGGDGEAAGRAIERALGGVGGGGGKHAANVLERQPLGRELGGIDLHPHRRLLFAADRHLRHAGNLRDLLGEDGIGIIVDGGEGQGVGMHAHHQDRRIRRD